MRHFWSAFFRLTGHPADLVGVSRHVNGLCFHTDLVRIQGLIFSHHIKAGGCQYGTVPQQGIAAGKAGHINVAGNRKHIPSLLRRLTGSNQCAAFLRRFHHQHTTAQTADDPVAFGKIVFNRRRTRWKLTQDTSVLLRIRKESLVGHGIYDIHTAAQHADHRLSGSQCPGHCHSVDTERHTRHHNAAAAADLIPHPLGCGQSVCRCLPGAHNADDGSGIPFRQAALVVEHHGRIGNIP